MTKAFFDHLKANHVQNYIEKVRAEVGHFYVTTALINAGLGIATTLVMMAWGMPTPYLWGAMAAVFNFIPYRGRNRRCADYRDAGGDCFVRRTRARGRRGVKLPWIGRHRRPGCAAALGRAPPWR